MKISDFGLTKKVSREMICMSNENRHWPVKWVLTEAIFYQKLLTHHMLSDVRVAFFSHPLIKRLFQSNVY